MSLHLEALLAQGDVELLLGRVGVLIHAPDHIRGDRAHGVRLGRAYPHGLFGVP